MWVWLPWVLLGFSGRLQVPMGGSPAQVARCRATTPQGRDGVRHGAVWRMLGEAGIQRRDHAQPGKGAQELLCASEGAGG